MTAERARPPLRALRREPGLIDDRIVGRRLAEAGLATEMSRWARAWLVCWQAALVEDARFGLDEPWDVPLALDRVVVPRGAGDPARRDVVLEALRATGLVVGVDGSGARSRLRVAREAFVEHPAAIGVDWPAVVAACAEPAPLLVLRALAEVAAPLDGFASIPRRDLVARTGYQQKQVRVAVRRLAALGLVDVDGDVGTTARYRLTPRALGQPWRAAPVPTPAPAAVPEPSAWPAPAPPPAAPAAGAGVEILLGGVAITIAPGAGFEIGPGMAARVELGDDGRPRLVIRPGG